MTVLGGILQRPFLAESEPASIALMRSTRCSISRIGAFPQQMAERFQPAEDRAALMRFRPLLTVSASFTTSGSSGTFSVVHSCPFGNAAKPRWRRLIRGQGHGWRAAPRPRAGNPQRQPRVRLRSGRWRLSRCRVSPVEVRYAAPRRARGLRCSSRASRPPDRAPPWPSGAAGKRGSETTRPCGVRPCGSGS
jgi:hypothetical protein